VTESARAFFFLLYAELILKKKAFAFFDTEFPAGYLRGAATDVVRKVWRRLLECLPVMLTGELPATNCSRDEANEIFFPFGEFVIIYLFFEPRKSSSH
jgi:hypothetical protein